MNILKSSLYTFGTKIFIVLTSIISSVLVVRMIGAEGKGIISYVTTFFGFIIMLGSIGMGNGLVFFASKEKDNIKYFNTTVLYGIIISFVVVLITSIFFTSVKENFFKNTPEEYIYVGLILLFVKFFSRFSESYCRAKKKAELYNISFLVGQIFYLTLILIFWIAGYQVIALYILGVKILQYVVQITIILKGLRVFPNLRETSFTYFNKMAKFSLKGFIGTISQKINVRVDVLLLGLMLSNEKIGYYAIGVTFAEIVWHIPNSIGVFLYPKIASENDSLRSEISTLAINRMTIAIVTAVAAIIFFSGGFLIPFLYGDNFYRSVLPLKILLIGTVGLSIHKILTKYFAGIGKPIISSYATLTGLLINLPLLYILLPKYEIIGAAIASTISYFAMGGISIYFFVKYSEGNYNIGDILLVNKDDFAELSKKIRKIIRK